MRAAEQLVLEEIACPLCGCARHVRVLTGRDNLCGVAGAFHVVRCVGCRHLYMNPRPVAGSLAACYPAQYGPHQADPEPPAGVHGADPDGAAGGVVGTVTKPDNQAKTATVATRPWYLRWLPLRHIPGLKRVYAWLLDDRSQPLPSASEHRLVRGLDPDTPLHALELGCATGRYLQRLERAGWQVRGVELSESASLRAIAAGLDVHNGVLETLAGNDAEFDLAAAWMCWNMFRMCVEPYRSSTADCGRADDCSSAFRMPVAGNRGSLAPHGTCGNCLGTCITSLPVPSGHCCRSVVLVRSR